MTRMWEQRETGDGQQVSQKGGDSKLTQGDQMNLDEFIRKKNWAEWHIYENICKKPNNWILIKNDSRFYFLHVFSLVQKRTSAGYL